MSLFKLFTGKISSVLTTAFQGLVKTVGVIVESITEAVDTVVDSLQAGLAPLTNGLTQLPLIGDTVGSVLDTVNNLIDNTSSTLHNVANNLQGGTVTGVLPDLLNDTTNLVGGVLSDASQVVQDVANLIPPSPTPLGVVNGVLDAVGDTLDNLSGFVDQTGTYVSNIEPLGLVSGLLSDPAGTVGDTLGDVSGILNNLLGDLEPVTNVLSDLPGIGTIVDGAETVLGHTFDGVGYLGGHISQLGNLNPFDSIGVWV